MEGDSYWREQPVSTDNPETGMHHELLGFV